MKFESLTLEQKKRINDTTREVLKDLGAPSHIDGYNYTIAAVLLMVADPNSKLPMTTDVGVYPVLAEGFHSKPSHVERGIRYLKDLILLKGNLKAVYTIFGNSAKIETGLMTNRNFLSGIKIEVLNRLGRLI